MFHTSCFMLHVSHFTHFTLACFMFHTSRFMLHVSHFTFHASRFMLHVMSHGDVMICVCTMYLVLVVCWEHASSKEFNFGEGFAPRSASLPLCPPGKRSKPMKQNGKLSNCFKTSSHKISCQYV